MSVSMHVYVAPIAHASTAPARGSAHTPRMGGVGREGGSTGVALRQRVQQRLRLLEVRRVKALGEPVVDWHQQLVGLRAFALLLPQAGEAHGGAQLQWFRLL